MRPSSAMHANACAPLHWPDCKVLHCARCARPGAKRLRPQPHACAAVSNCWEPAVAGRVMLWACYNVGGRAPQPPPCRPQQPRVIPLQLAADMPRLKRPPGSVAANLQQGGGGMAASLLPKQPAVATALSPAPLCGKVLRVIVMLCALALGVGELLPFFMAMRDGAAPIWDTILDYWGPYSSLLSIEAALLGLLTVACAFASAADHTRKVGSIRTAHAVIAVCNVAPVVGLLAWWWPGWQAVKSGEGGLSGLLEGLSYVSAMGCKMMMGLCMLPIARQSVWLDAASVGFPDAISFHRVTGWWCLAQVLIHSGSEIAAIMTEAASEEDGPTAIGEYNGTEWHAAWAAVPVFLFPWTTRLNDDTGQPEPNTEAVVNFCGVLGALGATILLVFALPWIRRARYDWFYLVHVPAAAFFVIMGACHNFPIQTFVVPGLVSYLIDRTDFADRIASSRHHKARATVRVMTDEWLRLDVATDALPSLTTAGAVGTQFMYLRVPALGREWHPFSLADTRPSVVIKATGDWTRRLHSLAASRAATGAWPYNRPCAHHICR